MVGMKAGATNGGLLLLHDHDLDRREMSVGDDHIVIASEAKQSNFLCCSSKARLLRRFAPRNDGRETCVLILATRIVRVLRIRCSLRDRGRREGRAPTAPAAPCAMVE